MVNLFITACERLKCSNATHSSESRKEVNNMYAVILTGGKQYKVEPGQIVKVEKLSAEVGESIKLDVLMVGSDDGVKVGNPILDGAYAEAEVVFAGRGKKLNIFKYKAKKNVRVRKGHRQPFTELKITNIVG